MNARLSATDITVNLIFVIVFGAGFVAPMVAPDSYLAIWIANHGLWVYFAICLGALVVVRVTLVAAFGLGFEYRRKGKRS